MTHHPRDGEFYSKLQEVLDEHFPKGKSKERGAALMLFAFANTLHNESRAKLLEHFKEHRHEHHTH